jgi:hypothetical protein
MKLSVVERIMLGDMMSKFQGNFSTIKIVRVAREALSFTEDELKKLDLKQEGTRVTWNNVAEKSHNLDNVEIDLSETTVDLIKRELVRLNDSSKLTDRFFSIYEKFVL